MPDVRFATRPSRLPLATRAILAAALLAGCAGATGAPPGPAPGALDGTQWRPLTLGGAPVGDAGRAMLRFEAGGELHGNDGCNGIGGSWQAAGNALSITLGPSTLMACGPALDGVAQELRAALAATRAFARDGNRLSLLGADGAAVAGFGPTEPASLVDAAFLVRSLSGGTQGLVSVPDGITMSARFGADGKISGSAGCNEYSGAYIAEGTSLAFSPLRATRKSCPGEAMSQEARFFAAMERVAGYRLGQRELALLDPDGALVASLLSAP